MNAFSKARKALGSVPRHALPCISNDTRVGCAARTVRIAASESGFCSGSASITSTVDR